MTQSSQFRRDEPKLGVPLAIAAVGHLLLVALLALHFDWHSYEPTPLTGELLDAPTIDISEVKKIQRQTKQRKQDDQRAEQEQRDKEQELERIKEIEAETERQQETERQRLVEEQAREEVRRKEDEAKRIALEKKKEQEEREQKEKAEADKKRKADEEKKRKAEEEKKKKDAEAKKKQEEEDKKRKADAEKKRKEDETKRRAQQEADLEAQMEEEAQTSAARKLQVDSEVAKYKALIYNKVKRNWIVPANPIGDCRVQVRLGPGGIVLDVSDGIGDAVLCRSAVAAVRKAEPLPVPTEADVFEEMRVINFKMDPKDTKQ
jgi:colicin import membrane protein